MERGSERRGNTLRKDEILGLALGHEYKVHLMLMATDKSFSRKNVDEQHQYCI